MKQMPNQPPVPIEVNADTLPGLNIPLLSSERARMIPIQTVNELISKFRQLSFAVVHMEKYADSAEGQAALLELVNHTVANIKSLREKVDGGTPIEAIREEFIKYLGVYLQFAQPRLVRYLLPSRIHKVKHPNSTPLPLAFKNLFEAYIAITR
jgi:hypothetical protein